MLRLYRECDNSGSMLDPACNHEECISEAPHVFHLPVGDSSIEPSQWTQASAILTSVRMYKLHDRARDWRMDPDDAELMLELYDSETGES